MITNKQFCLKKLKTHNIVVYMYY